MDQNIKFGEPSPSTSVGQTRPPRAQPHPSTFTRATDDLGDLSHGPVAYHPRHRPLPPPPSVLDHQDRAEMSEDAHRCHSHRPWSSPDPDPKMMAPYPSREGRRPHSSHHLDPSSSSSSSRSKNEPYYYSRHHVNPASAQFGHSFPTEQQSSPRISPPPSNKPPILGTHGTHGTYGYMNPPQDRTAGSAPHHGTLCDADTKMPPVDKILDQESDDDHTVDHPPEKWYPSSGPPDWRHGHDPRDHSVRSSHPYRGDPLYPYTHPYHHYRPLSPGMTRSYGPNDWPYQYDYDPRHYMRYGPQPWGRPGPGWNYVPDSRYSERGRYRPPPPEYRGDSFGHPGWVQRYPYRAHDPTYDPQGSPLETSDMPRPQHPLQPQHQNHYAIANDSHSHPSRHNEDIELRRHQTEYSYQGEEHGSGAPPSPPLAGASASKAKTTTPTSVTTALVTQKQLKVVDTQDVQTKQEPVILRPRQDKHYLLGLSPALAPDQTRGAIRARPHPRGSSESLLQGTLHLTSTTGDDLSIQAVSSSLPPRLKIDSRTDYPSSLPPPERQGYRTIPSRDMYPEASLSDPKFATPSMSRHDRERIWSQSLDGRSLRIPTHPEARGRTGSLPGYLVDSTQGMRDGIRRPPPLLPAGSPPGMGSLKSATISFQSPPGSPTRLLTAAHSSSTSLSPPPVKLGQEGYYSRKDLEQLFRIWKSEYERSSSDHLRRGNHPHQHQHRLVGGQDDGENMDESHGSSSSNNDMTTTVGPSWREKAKWKWDAMLQEFGPDGKKRKTMNDHQRVAEELVDEYGPSQHVRGEGREHGQVNEFEDELVEEDEDGDEGDYESDPQGELWKRRTESAGETSESGSSHEAQDGIRHQTSRDVRHHGTSYHPIAPSGPSVQPDGSSVPVDSNMLVEAALAKKRRIRVRESKNHWCEQCGKCFSRPSQLLTHSFTHSGEKPHQCPMCYKHFNVASNLKRHIRTHASSRRKSSRVGNTVFRGFALGYPTARTLNAESTSNTTTESVSASTSVSATANTNLSQEASNTDDNHGQPGFSDAQGLSIRASTRTAARPAVKHLLVPEDGESKSNSSSSGSGSSTGRVPVMPPPSAPLHHARSTRVPGSHQKDGSGQHRGHVDVSDSVEMPDTEV